MKKLIIILLLTPFLASAQKSYSNKLKREHPEYPDSSWNWSDSPDDFDLNKLQNLKKFIADSVNTTGMIVVYKGKVIFEFGDVKEPSPIASVRKSVLSILYGFFIENKVIRLSTSLEELKIDDIGGLLPTEKKATVRDLLTARSGVYHVASNSGDAYDRAPKRGSIKPGSFWLYNNWDFNTAGYVLELQTGKCIYELTDSLLAKPLQMQDWHIGDQKKEGDINKSKYLSYSMSLSARDMARLGYLMLNKGRWKNKQLIPESWIKTTTSIVTTNEEAQKNKMAYMNFGYGYLWWIWDKPYNKGYFDGAYTASGIHGQFITILPQLNIVIAHKTNWAYQRSVTTEEYMKIIDMLIAAKRD